MFWILYKILNNIAARIIYVSYSDKKLLIFEIEISKKIAIFWDFPQKNGKIFSP